MRPVGCCSLNWFNLVDWAPKDLKCIVDHNEIVSVFEAREAMGTVLVNAALFGDEKGQLSDRKL